LVAFHRDKINGDDEERQETESSRGEDVDCLHSDHPDSESSNELESDYADYAEEADGDDKIGTHAEADPRSDDMNSTQTQQTTPHDIQKALRALHQASLDSIPEGLAMEVSHCSLLCPSRSSIFSRISIFVARSTGVSRSQQLFVCRNPTCSARAVYTIEDRVVRFVGANFVHDHDPGAMTVAGARAMDTETREEICHLTELRLTGGQIRLQLGLSESPQVLYNIRRNQLREYRTAQALRLENEITKYPDFDTCLLKQQPHFVACYFFHTAYMGTQICQATLIMDDTSCKNRYDLPVLVILGIDECK
jgi:hypothetical protein